MPKRYKRHFIRTKDVKSLLSQASEKLKADLKRSLDFRVNMELVETDFANILLIDGKPLLVKTEESVFPTLIFNKLFVLMPKAVVDMGAIPHICNGADVMAPGIVRFEGEFSKGDLILVVDERHGKPIVIGEAVYNMDAADKVTEGVVVKNIHFIGDKIWDFVKKISNKP
jgi:PUA-domain protein